MFFTYLLIDIFLVGLTEHGKWPRWLRRAAAILFPLFILTLFASWAFVCVMIFPCLFLDVIVASVRNLWKD